MRRHVAERRIFETRPRRVARGALAAASVVCLLALSARPAAAQAPRDFLARLAAEPYAPVVKVVDTESSLGPLATTIQTVTLADLTRFHGHPCDGLVAASAAIAYGLHALFPDGVVDRTDVIAAVKPSPCFSDAAAYLTGARTQFGTLALDPALGDTWILHRRSTGRTVAVSLRDGIKPRELPDLEARLRSEDCDRALMARVRQVQDGYATAVIARPPAQIFTIEDLPSFPYKDGGIRPDATKAACKAGAPAVSR